MLNSLTRRHALASAVALALGLTSVAAHSATTLTVLNDGGPQTVGAMNALAADFSARNPGIKIDIETRPGGTEGDNLIKTRLATGEMTDVFLYNAGSI